MNHKKNIAICAMLLMFIATVSCGGSSGGNPDLSWGAEYQSEWHNLFNSKNYSGYLAVMFKDGTEMRLNGKALNSVSELNYSNVVNDWIDLADAEVERGLTVSEEVIEKALERAQRERKKLHDWNLYYKIRVSDPDMAEILFSKLAESEFVRWVHPIPTPHVADVGDIGDTGSTNGGGSEVPLTEQLYLDTEEATGGLNIYAAWNAGITGQGVRIVDQEHNWNLSHEDIPLSIEDKIFDSTNSLTTFDVNDPHVINHGTAVVGILSSINDGDGFTGIAYSSELKLVQIGESEDSANAINLISALLQAYSAEGLTTIAYLPYQGAQSQEYDLFIRPGDIILLETQWPGANTIGDDCNVDLINNNPTYCLPPESYPAPFDMIEDATTLGVIVVEGSGNGGIDLGSDNALPKTNDCGAGCPDLSVDDSGAIMVAASNSQKDHSKTAWSNWGSRINAFAWGYDVVTTGYGDHPASNPGDENQWYTTNFNGASSAAALVGGVVALIQSHTKVLYENIVPHKQVYLDAYQVRCLIDQMPVTGADNFTANIGRKPDVGLMMEKVSEANTTCDYGDINGDGAVDDKDIVDLFPRLAPDTPALRAKPLAVEGIRYDLDKDGRADLISYTAGTWNVDLSSVAPNVVNPNPDNFGAWDLQIDMAAPVFNNSIIYPVVHDYDSDGDADLAIYDSKYGYWYIKYTTDEVLNAPKSSVLEWDIIVDYSNDPMWEPYSRPMPGDYNDDNWLDLAVVTSDGHWVMDFGGIGYLEKVGDKIVFRADFEIFEKDVKFLTNDQLIAAPGWAYVPIAVNESGHSRGIFYKSPDSIENGEEFKYIKWSDYSANSNFTDQWLDDYTTTINPFMYGSNGGKYVGGSVIGSYFSRDILVLNEDGLWDVINGNDGLVTISEIKNLNWGGSEMCYPVIADYNGDGKDDPAVMCSSGWKIGYYEEVVDMQTGFSTFELASERIVDLDNGALPLPPTVYPGGMRYQDIKGTLEYYGLWAQYQNKDPFTPFTVQCIKHWAPPPMYCLAK